MSHKIICYNCLHKFPAHKVWFRCDNAPERSSEHCRIQEDPLTGQMTTRAFPLRGFGGGLSSIFKIPKQAVCTTYCYNRSTKIRKEPLFCSAY